MVISKKIRNIIKIDFMKQQLIVFFLLVIFSTIVSKGIFISFSNMNNIFKQVSIVGIIAVGQLMVILTGGIDLSVGSILALTTVVVSYCNNCGYSIILSLVIGFLVGLLCGFINGLFISKVHIPPFLATLAMMNIARGVAYILSGGNPIYISQHEYFVFARSDIMGINTQIFIWIFVILIGIFILKRTTLGRFIYMTGGNEKCAYFSAINVKIIKIFVYTISGLFAAVAGIILTSKLGMGAPFLSEWSNLDSIAAVVIGGASLNGGKGTMAGTIVGTLILGSINNLMNITNISPYFQKAIIGFIIISAVYMNYFHKDGKS